MLRFGARLIADSACTDSRPLLSPRAETMWLPMRAVLIGIAFLSLTATSGCGTMFNAFGPRRYPHAYGGVEIDCMALQATWTKQEGEKQLLVAEKLLLTGMIAVDFPLCVVGDTLTLPGVILQSGFQKSGWDLGKFQTADPTRYTMPDLSPTLMPPEAPAVLPRQRETLD
jgi:uncharacterized protein YceK